MKNLEEHQSQLLPCPFCQSTLIMPDIISLRVVSYTNICQNCQAKIGYYETQEEADKAWNTRNGNTIMLG